MLNNEFQDDFLSYCHFFIDTYRAWDKPKEFNPDRWIEDDLPKAIVKGESLKGAPRCPFSFSKNALSLPGGKKSEEILAETKKVSNGSDDMYSGLGHKEGSLSFFPFSAGARSCPAKSLGLQIIRKVRNCIISYNCLFPSQLFYAVNLFLCSTLFINFIANIEIILLL